MQLFTQEMELRCILTVVDPEIPEHIRSSLLGKLDTDFFHYPPARAAFVRLSTIAKKRAELIEFDDLVEDPAIDEDFREILKECEIDTCTSKKAITRMILTLANYRKLRSMYTTCTKVIEKLKDEAAEPDELLDFMANNVAKARRDLAQDQKIMRIGKKTNAKDVVHGVLNKVREALIKSGFEPYDKKNGGLPREGVMILSSTTSGGKSVSLMQLCKNIYEMSDKKDPNRIVRISLEMGEEQEMRRLLSNLTRIPLWKFTRNKLSIQEKRKVNNAYKKFVKAGKKNGSQYDTLCPTRDMTIEEIFQMVKPYGYNIVGIDYISLLAGVDSDNQWRILSAIARLAKVFSRENHCLVILLCQLDDESSKLRYSKGIKEHCDVMWSWNYSDPAKRETKLLPIKVDKARDAELFSFDMQEQFEIMTVSNVSGGGAYDSSDDVDDDENNDDDDDDSNSKKKSGDDYALS